MILICDPGFEPNSQIWWAYIICGNGSHTVPPQVVNVISTHLMDVDSGYETISCVCEASTTSPWYHLLLSCDPGFVPNSQILANITYCGMRCQRIKQSLHGIWMISNTSWMIIVDEGTISCRCGTSTTPPWYHLLLWCDPGFERNSKIRANLTCGNGVTTNQAVHQQHMNDLKHL